MQYIQNGGLSEKAPLYWRYSKELSGSGVLGDLGSHMIDITRFLIGEFQSVCGQLGTFITKRKLQNSKKYGKVDVDDYCNFIAELEGEIPATFELSRFVFGRGNHQRIEIYGEKGGLIYSRENDGSLEVCIGKVYGDTLDYHTIPVPHSFEADQMESFFDIINGKEDGLSATIKDGCINQKIIDSVIESYNNKKWVLLSEE